MSFMTRTIVVEYRKSGRTCGSSEETVTVYHTCSTYTPFVWHFKHPMWIGISIPESVTAIIIL